MITYSSSIVSLSNNSILVDNINNEKIGIITVQTSPDGYIIPNIIIKEKKLNNIELVKYENYIDMLTDLYDKKIDLAFLPTTYKTMYSSLPHFENINNDTKIIYSQNKEYKNTSKETSTESITKPFTLLIMGIDSEIDDISSVTSFNGDSLTLITFNPETLNTTFLSIPRDTFVPIACFKNKYENKITHAAWQGENCMIETIQEWMGINIDYYVKINFKGLVALVNALDGITIDVPYNFCEQDSNRLWGKNTVFVDKGIQTLNGEQVLALARHRKETAYMKQYCGKKYIGNNVSDTIRGQNQLLIIKSILNKTKEIRNLDTIYNVLDATSKNMDTNITTNQILSLYNVLKKILINNTSTETFSIQKLYLTGYDQYIYDDTLKLPLYNYIYYRGSLRDIINAMKLNLNIEKPQLIKEFTFSINNNWTEEIIGTAKYKVEDYINVLPDWTKSTKTEVDAWAKKFNFKINYEYENSSKYENNQIIKQSYPYGYRLDSIKNNTITITIAKKETTTITYVDCSIEENNKNTKCLMPNFINKTIDEFNTWYKNLTKYKITISSPIMTEIKKTDDNYDETQKGKIIYQSKEEKTLLKNIVSLEIKYIKKEDPIE